MSDNSIGRWWDKSWTLVEGCTWPAGTMPPACARCWARAMAKRFHKDQLSAVEIREDRLGIPEKTRKPTVFACQISYGDLFHPSVPRRFIVAVVAAAAASPRHTFVFLTKRPHRVQWLRDNPPNVFIVASVWDQQSTNEACEAFQALPSALRWGLHMEPLLERVDLAQTATNRMGASMPSWIAVGGESGPGARPMDERWVVELRDRCRAAGVSFYFKGWGEWRGGVRVGKKHSGRALNGAEHNDVPWRERPK